YCNSILQALYFCKPFRECVINFPNVSVGSTMPSISSQTQQSSNTNSKKDPVNGDNKVNGDSNIASTQAIENTLFGALKDLFWKISIQKKRTGVLAPNNFVTKLKKENELFRSTMHQDAHEFLNYVLNAIAENVLEQQNKIAEAERLQREQLSSYEKSSKSSESNSGTSPQTTWVHQLFEGTLTNETKCLTCETVTSRDESFLDLSIDIEQNSSFFFFFFFFFFFLLMKIKKLPNVLALHLKRFKYQDKLQRYIKLSYRVVFPFELRLFNTCDDMEDPDRLYELYAICVHIGSGPYHGHYVTLVKSMGQWLLFDDENVDPVDEAEIQKYFGDSPGTGSGYVLFYQACDLDQNVNGLSNTIWTNNNVTSSSASSTELEALEANDSFATDVPITTNGTIDHDNNASVTNNVEPRRHPTREPSFSDRLQLWKNSTEKRKSNSDQENGKEHNTTSKKDKKAEKEERKREKKLEKSKKLEKEKLEKEKEKLEKEKEKLEKEKLPTSPNEIQATM
ncbi:hypothetical protein C2G38_1964389, partial [Gigaspora rosea]